ncbi:MAG: sulfatase-like hydrolase/transferase, partial [Bacteroidetes bacterium]|nr:sulfatase-like hydrolase/transferase [Bacteroidota bacterium]
MVLVLFLLIPVLCNAQKNANQEKPNMVFILVDDLGWADLGCYGNGFIETPAIDRLAESGMRFTAAYTASVCTPSRGMILSGQYNART